MSLRKPWKPMNKVTVNSAPTRYGLYELGNSDGESVGFGVGVLRDELKEVLAYGDASKVRWQVAQDRAHAERLADEHTAE